MKHAVTAAAAAVAFLAAGCSSAPGGPMSAAAAARATGPAADRALVCHHYMKQRAWARSLAQPTIADALRAKTDLAADVTQSEGTGKLHADLQALYRAGKTGTYTAAQRVYQDCATIGITR